MTTQVSTSGQSNVTKGRVAAAHGRVQSYSPGGATAHLHLIHASLDPPEYISDTASSLVRPFFLHSSRQSVPILYNGWPFSPFPLSNTIPRAHPSPQPKRHLGLFSRFCRAQFLHHSQLYKILNVPVNALNFSRQQTSCRVGQSTLTPEPLQQFKDYRTAPCS